MRDDTQLTQEERYQIESLLKVGHRQSKIATVLKRHKSTISREVGRNRGLHGYRPKQAQHLALARREAKAKPRIAPGTWEWVESLLREEWSLEQVSGWLSMEQGLHVSHEWIYQYVCIMDRLNNRPRKCLGFKTPNQLFSGINPPVALAS